MDRTPLQLALEKGFTAEEAEALWDALGQYVENLQDCLDTYPDDNDEEINTRRLRAAEAVLERMNLEHAKLANPEGF